MWKLYRDKMNHLSEEIKYELIQEYYKGELSNTKIIKKYGMKNITAGGLHKCFPTSSSDRICRHCKSEMGLLPKSKLMNEYDIFECSICAHIESTNNFESCFCNHCTTEKRLIEIEKNRKKTEEILRKKELIFEMFSNHQATISDVKDYSIVDVITLGAFLELYLNENSEHTGAISLNCGKLTPIERWNNEIISNLYENGLIAVSEKSPFEAFYENSKDFPQVFDMSKVFFYPTLNNSNRELSKIQGGDLNYFLNIKSEDEQNLIVEEIYNFWKMIGVNECIEFLLYQMSKVGLKFSPGKKTHDMFEYLLDHLSISEIFSLIFSGVTYSCRIQIEKKIYPRHLSNTVISIVRSNGDKVISGDWQKKSFNRPFNPEQSKISKFFFFKLLKIGSMGYEVTPNLELLRNQILKMYNI